MKASGEKQNNILWHIWPRDTENRLKATQTGSLYQQQKQPKTMDLNILFKYYQEEIKYQKHCSVHWECLPVEGQWRPAGVCLLGNQGLALSSQTLRRHKDTSSNLSSFHTCIHVLSTTSQSTGDIMSLHLFHCTPFTMSKTWLINMNTSFLLM